MVDDVGLGEDAALGGDVVELHALNTEPEYRGKGEAKTLLLKTCVEADLGNKVLFIKVEPTRDSPSRTNSVSYWFTLQPSVTVRSARPSSTGPQGCPVRSPVRS